MIAFTNEASDILDRYLRRARISLRGTSVDADDVERDVRDHIGEALADRESPVGAAALSEVLAKLGSPTQWVPDEDLSIWRRTVVRLTEGPEDWRLAYWCFALTIVGFITVPLGIGVFILGGAVFLSRAAIALSEEREEPLGPKRWLIYPVLVFFSIVLIMIPLLLPVGGMAAFASETWPDGSAIYLALGVNDSLAELVTLIVACTGAWWIILAGIAAIAARPIRKIFVPLANGFRPLHAGWLALAGVALLAGSGVILTLV